MLIKCERSGLEEGSRVRLIHIVWLKEDWTRTGERACIRMWTGVRKMCVCCIIYIPFAICTFEHSHMRNQSAKWVPHRVLMSERVVYIDTNIHTYYNNRKMYRYRYMSEGESQRPIISLPLNCIAPIERWQTWARRCSINIVNWEWSLDGFNGME